MQISHSTLLLLDQAGDKSAATILRAWVEEAGIMIKPSFLQVHYNGAADRFTMKVDGTPGVVNRCIVVPAQWCQIDYAPLVKDVLRQALTQEYKAYSERFGGTVFNPNTLDMDLAVLYDCLREE